MVKQLRVSPEAGHEPPAFEPDVVGELRKQVSLMVPLSEWRLIRDEAARRRLPMTVLVHSWLIPHLADLRRRTPQPLEEPRT